MFRFFEKTMGTNLMVEAGSALSREVKIATLAEEIKGDSETPAWRLSLPKGWKS